MAGTAIRHPIPGALRHPVAEAHHLHDLEQKGESAATPLLAITEVLLVLIPIFALIVGGAFAAYYLS
jgi:hypothetical protein